ncbi:receptor like protein 26-like [Abrus precatorius]|uniref:Receptor like protein 26-like n=1 Tax=Abrus precatorius TaxID=3816 RepID=A0A8B8JHV7_ABRPR|nr:receptor like protein 26-like [Abrus precatorius]
MAMVWFLLPYFFTLLLQFPSYTFSLCKHHDSSALLQFKNSLSLNNQSQGYWYWIPSTSFSSKTETWINGTDCCKWGGVTCHPMSGHVIGLDLSCSNLEGGDIPSTISHLSKLVSLDLSADWRVPNYLGSMYLRMRLDPLTWNKLIHNATSLRELCLDAVDMSSIGLSSFSLLRNFSSSLVTLSLQVTQLQGNLPSDIFFLPNLQKLSLFYNQGLNGELPKYNWSTPLRYLDLSYTTFSGEIPDSIGHLKPLNILNLMLCQFDGPIPLSLWNLTQLRFLILRRNNLNGEIPSLISNLKHLTFFDLSYNNFSGSIPDVFGNFTKLENLTFSNNKLSGLIPSSLFHLPQLADLILDSNNLVGPIPSKITERSKLRAVSLFDNMVNGTIPNWCYSLPSLSTLILDNNQLTGSISGFSNSSLEILYLSRNKLQGNFPNSIFELKSLTQLSLSSTDLSGVVNFHQFSKLKNLEALDLSRNGFLNISIDDSIDYSIPTLDRLYLSFCNINRFPQFLAQLPNLKTIDLSHNKIHGNIPKWFHEKLLHSWKNILYIDLSFNQLQGDLPILPNVTQFFSVSNNNFTGDIPSTVCRVSFLIVLNLAHNNLTGLIPECLGTLGFLKVLDLQMNNFYGRIPRNFCEGNALETIKLNGNQLEGTFPESLVHCTYLEVLDLADNYIEDTFPSWLETQQELQVLSLRSNKLHGVIASLNAKNPFPKLKIFDVSNNNFSGPLPASYIKNFQGMMIGNEGQTGLKYVSHNGSYNYNESVVIIMKGQTEELVRILTTFTAIDLSKNMFEGEIPKVVGDLTSLKGLNLSHNRITGTVPQSLGNLRNLEWLDLSWNQLIGEIPIALTNLNFLSFLNLSQNQFEGIIPTGRQFNTFENDSYGGNPMLCGIPLSKSCNNDEKLPPHSTFDHQESGFGWKPVVMGYASGVVFGLLLGYKVFLTGKPQCLARYAEGVTNRRVQRKNDNRARANRRGIS